MRILGEGSLMETVAGRFDALQSVNEGWNALDELESVFTGVCRGQFRSGR